MTELMTVLEAVADRVESKAKKRIDGIAFAEVDPRSVDDEGVLDEWDELVWSGEAQTRNLVSCSKEPRGGMFTYNYSRAVVPLPSGRRLYLEWGDMTEFQALGVAGPDAPEAVDLRLIQLHGPGAVDIPFSVAGDLLFEIDVVWTEAAHGGFVLDALTDPEADWMDGALIGEGDEWSNAAEQALDEAEEEGELPEDELDALSEGLAAAPPWFLGLSEDQLDRVANLPVPEADRDPPLRHEFAPWQKPTGEMFLRDTDPVNLQHIVAAWVVGGFS